MIFSWVQFNWPSRHTFVHVRFLYLWDMCQGHPRGCSAVPAGRDHTCRKARRTQQLPKCARQGTGSKGRQCQMLTVSSVKNSSTLSVFRQRVLFKPPRMPCVTWSTGAACAIMFADSNIFIWIYSGFVPVTFMRSSISIVSNSDDMMIRIAKRLHRWCDIGQQQYCPVLLKGLNKEPY